MYYVTVNKLECHFFSQPPPRTVVALVKHVPVRTPILVLFNTERDAEEIVGSVRNDYAWQLGEEMWISVLDPLDNKSVRHNWGLCCPACGGIEKVRLLVDY